MDYLFIKLIFTFINQLNAYDKSLCCDVFYCLLCMALISVMDFNFAMLVAKKFTVVICVTLTNVMHKRDKYNYKILFIL